jgi:hypothetical protein
VPLLHQVRGLLGDAGDRGPAQAAQVWTALLVVVVVPVLVVYGHGEEDALALLALVVALRLAGRSSPGSRPAGAPGSPPAGPGVR